MFTCQTAFDFLKWNMKDLVLSRSIPMQNYKLSPPIFIGYLRDVEYTAVLSMLSTCLPCRILISGSLSSFCGSISLNSFLKEGTWKTVFQTSRVQKMPLFIFVLVRFKHQNHNARFIQFILIEMPSPRPYFRVFGEVFVKDNYSVYFFKNQFAK